MKKKKRPRAASQKSRVRKTAPTALPEPGIPAVVLSSTLPYRPWKSLVLWVGWGMTLLAFFTRPQFWFLLPKGYPLGLMNITHYWPLLLAGLSLMVLATLRVPEEDPGPDVSPWKARFFFTLAMVLAWVLRMNDAEKLPALARIDHWYILSAARHVLDFGEHPLLIPPDGRPPFVTYALAAVWFFIPKATGVFAIRLFSTLMDLTTAWVMYLCGREINGRRMGLILMVMVAVSKSLIECTKYDLAINSAVMICALFAFFLLKVLKDPTPGRFLQLGIVLGLGDYGYTPVRPYIPAILIGLLIWILWSRERRPKARLEWILALGLGAAWVLTFVCKNSSIGQKIPLAAFLTHGWGAIVLWAGLVFVYFQAKKQAREGLAVRWAFAAFVAALIEAPLWMDPDYYTHPAEVAIWSEQFHHTLWTALQSVFSNFIGSFHYLYGSNGELALYPIQDRDCFMDYFFPIFGLVGLASYLAKPDWFKTFILGFYLLGVLPVLLSVGMMWPHLLGCLVPLFFLAGAGVHRLWQALASFGRGGRVAGALFLLLVGGFFAVKNAQWVGFWEDQRSPDLLGDDIITEEVPTDRVYLVSFAQHFLDVIPDHVSDGKDVHMAGPSNPIDLGPEEKGKDVAAIVYSYDTATQDRIQRDFPGTVWNSRKSLQGNVELRWAVIPFGNLSESPDKFFYVRRHSAEDWDRKFYGDYGLARGTVLYEDRTPNWSDSFPATLLRPHTTGRLQGIWVVGTEGSFSLKVQTENSTKIWVDGRLVLCSKPPVYKPIEKRIRLAKGIHEVELATAFNAEVAFPVVAVHSENEGWLKPLDSLSKTGF